MHYILQIFKRNYHNNLSIKYIKYFKSKLEANDYLKNTFTSYTINTIDVDTTNTDCVTGYIHDYIDKIIYDFSLLSMPCPAELLLSKDASDKEEQAYRKNIMSQTSGCSGAIDQTGLYGSRDAEYFAKYKLNPPLEVTGPSSHVISPSGHVISPTGTSPYGSVNETYHNKKSILEKSEALDVQFDRSEDSLPAGWIYDYNNVLTPIRMSDLKTNPELVITYDNLTNAQQRALVIARINKMPVYKYDETLYTHLNAKMCLEHINKNTNIGYNIISKEITWLNNYLNELLDNDDSEDFTNDTDESSDDE